MNTTEATNDVKTTGTHQVNQTIIYLLLGVDLVYPNLQCLRI